MSETIITNVSSATTTNCGVVKVGNGLSVTADGTLSAKTHGNETWISTSITLAGEGSWTATSNNTCAEITSWFNNYDRVFASLVKGSDNILKFGEEIVELLKNSDGSIRSMPINIEYASQLSTITDELIVIMNEEMLFTTVTASKSDTPDTATITWNGTSSNLNWKNVDTLYKAGRRLQVLSTEWGEDKFILPLVSVVNDGNNKYVFSAHYTDGQYAEVWIWHDPSIPNENHENEIGSSITSTKLADGAVTTAKIADGAITKAKLASDVGGAEATSTTLGEVYASVNSSMPSFIPLGYVYSQKKEGLVISSIKDGVITTQHLADGAVTTDKLASGAVGGGSIFSDGTLNEGTLLSSVSFNCGSFNMYLVSFKLGSSRSAEISYTVNETKLVISPTSTETNHVTPPSPIGTNVKASHAFTWFQPKSTSARAALATLLPVQDECEEMEAEVAKLEQDWIDNPDETVAVDGNGVPVTIAAKKTALEAKKAELEKLREDYFSKLGDWKNEVQE